MNCRRALAASLGIMALSPVHANRPLTTDTADTIPVKRCQLEPYVASTRVSGSPTQRATILQLNCGVRDDTQIGMVYSHESAGGARSDLIAAAGKTYLIELKDGQTGVAVNYGLSALKLGGGSWEHEGTWLTLIASRRLSEALLGHANLGWSRSQTAKQHSTTWGLALEWAVAPKLTLSAEAYGDDRERPWVGVGLWSPITDQFSVNVSVGAQSSNPRIRQVTAGFNFEF